MAVNWSNTAAQDYFLTVRRGQLQTTTAMPGVWSETSEDHVFFDTEWYRDEIDATFMGAPRSLIVEDPGGTPDALIIPNGNNVASSGVLNAPVNYATVNDPQFEQSDSFTHTAPRPLEKTRSKTLWWDAADGGGNVVGWAWTDEIYTLLPVKTVKTT